MTFVALEKTFALCRDISPSDVDLNGIPYFFAHTQDETSLLCPQDAAPCNAERIEAPWRGFYVAGQLDFSLTGILAHITAVLAQSDIPVFAISTFDTDYIFVKADMLEAATHALRAAGHKVR
ncbi:ACT domain-containing protein [Eubacteriales bacterium OttesenSCG-928-M02]|nr:ACT domain-containing protein [Eubacteriales bacterium OttesenSCG-928-M02]